MSDILVHVQFYSVYAILLSLLAGFFQESDRCRDIHDSWDIMEYSWFRHVSHVLGIFPVLRLPTGINLTVSTGISRIIP